MYQIRQQLEEHGDKIAADVRGNIESAIASVEEKVKGDDAEAITRALDELNKVAMELGKAVYEQQAQSDAASPPPEDGATPQGSDDVIDAEYEVKE